MTQVLGLGLGEVVMQLGDIQLRTISGGKFLIDGGTMFGVVPRTMWEPLFPADDQHRIRQATNCVLVSQEDQHTLIDTGYGSKLSDKQRDVFQSEAGDPLLESLAAHSITPDQISTVILSHLHFDHAGGATRMNEQQLLVPTFPNAEYVVQRREWMIATAELPELRGAYPQDNLLPLKESGQLRLIDGDQEIIPGFHSMVTGGHTAAHQVILIEHGDLMSVYLGDICPTSRHLKTLWGMAYDVDLLQVRRQKSKILSGIADQGWLALFDHDPDVAAAYLDRDPKKEFVVAEQFAQL